MVRMMWRSSVVLPDLVSPSTISNGFSAKSSSHCGQVFFALTDDDPIGAPYTGPSAAGARLVGSSRTGGAVTPGWRALIAATWSSSGAANRKCSAAMVRPATRLVGGHAPRPDGAVHRPPGHCCPARRAA